MVDFGAMREIIKENITEYDQHVFGIGPHQGEVGPSFMYTIGNYERDLPELIIGGLFMPQLTGILNVIAHIQRENGKGFEDGELVDLGGKFPVKIIHASDEAKKEYTIWVENYYGDVPYEVHQVLLCDQNGVFPDQPNCAAPFNKQFILKDVYDNARVRFN